MSRPDAIATIASHKVAKTQDYLESAGADMLWVAELYSFDAISILGYLAAHTERVSGVFTIPGLLPKAGPVGMRSYRLMTIALRVMGNFITDEDRDTTARVWRWAGRRSVKLDARPPWS